MKLTSGGFIQAPVLMTTELQKTPTTSFQQIKSSMTALHSTATSSSSMDDIKVAIIGAGAAGLAAARVMTRNGISSVTVFEKSQLQSSDRNNGDAVSNSHGGLGGVWKYEESPQIDTKTGKTIAKPMYKGLRTNLPREIMRFREKPWGRIVLDNQIKNSNGETDNANHENSYVTHQEVLNYLEGYANDYDLNSFIQYGCEVTQLIVEEDKISCISPHFSKKKDQEDKPWPKITLQWKQKHQNEAESNNLISDTFDMVCICNGHYAKPSCPDIPGIEHFKGKIMHSVEYDDPHLYTNKTVLCIGGRASGADIAREISQYAKRVYLSDSAFPEEKNGVPLVQDNVVWVPRTEKVERISQKACIYFGNNCELIPNDVDVIVFCSGYDYEFPFINGKSNLEFSAVAGERRVGPLYKQIWHANCPTLSFIGLPHSVVPFPLFEIQAEAIHAQITQSTLPSLNERIVDAQKDFTSGGPNGSNGSGRVVDTHFLGSHQWDYCRLISKISGYYNEELEKYISTNKAIYDHSGQERKGLFPGGEDLYRETVYARDDTNKSFAIIRSKISDCTKLNNNELLIQQ